MPNRILVIEDDERIADSLERGLSEEGFSVRREADGLAGRRALSEGPWDLIILDWLLPGSDGLTLLRRFREAGGETPVLLLTARDAVSDRVRGLDSGADDYLCKPFAFDELLARVRAQLRRTSRPAASTLDFGDIRIDRLLGRAERAGNPLDLTPKGLALLTYFLRHPEETLTRRRIYEQVWEASYEGLSNTLEYHIVELRRRLEAHGPRLIHTVRGKGYRFSDRPKGDS